MDTREGMRAKGCVLTTTLAAARVGTPQEAADLEERKMEAVRREMTLGRQLKEAKGRQDELAAMLAAERTKRQQGEAALNQEIEKLNKAWRKAAAEPAAAAKDGASGR